MARRGEAGQIQPPDLQKAPLFVPSWRRRQAGDDSGTLFVGIRARGRSRAGMLVRTQSVGGARALEDSTVW